MSKYFLDTPIEYLKGVGPKRAELLKKEIGVYTFNDLLHHFPFRYIDRSVFMKIRDVNNDLVYIQLKGIILNLQVVGKGRAQRLTATLRDDTGEIDLVWFRGVKWIIESIKPGIPYVVFGKPNLFKKNFNIPHPEIELVEEYEKTISQTQEGIYSSTEKLKQRGLSNRNLIKLVKTLVAQIPGKIPETLSNAIISNLSLISREQALTHIHFPTDQHMLKKASGRLKFEELFFIQLRLLS